MSDAPDVPDAPARREFPVHLRAERDPGTSRALWLVKWLLALPHYLVLAFLWVAFVVTTVTAFFAILLTGRYPRALFDFNVGVLRWSWRVSFYAYGALGTDRYPPFSLHDVPDYPAHLEVDHPEHLSRGLVLVKSWLLAVPHYLVLAPLLGGVGFVAPDDAGGSFAGLGLIAALVLVAAGFLLFTGRYPAPLFDLVVGLNRWVYRVAGYAALMTDAYPPFALDQGGRDPAQRWPGAPTRADDVPPTATRATGWTPSRVVSLTLGAVLVLAALGLGATAGTAAWVDQAGRDRDGFVTTDPVEFRTHGRAIVSSSFRLHADDVPGDFLPARIVGDTRLSAVSDAGTPLFLGLGRADDVEDYLGGASHDIVTGLRHRRPVYRRHVGEATPAPPTAQDFWVAEDSGSGRLDLTWTPAEGEWTYVVMNGDARPVVEADLTVGAELPGLGRAAAVLVGLATVLLLLGLVLVALPVRAVSRGAR